MNKEIEYSKKVESLKRYIDYLNKLPHTSRTSTSIDRDIYKNDSKYFVKISQEITEKKQTIVFSLKEDLTRQGLDGKVKKADEVDLVIDKDQLPGILAIISLLGFSKDTHFKKERLSYSFENVTVDLDTYHTADGKQYNLEIEGKTEEDVKDFILKLEQQGKGKKID